MKTTTTKAARKPRTKTTAYVIGTPRVFAEQAAYVAEPLNPAVFARMESRFSNSSPDRESPYGISEDAARGIVLNYMGF